MKICFNDNEIKKVKSRECSTCSLRFHSTPCIGVGVCSNNVSLDFESPSEVFKL